MTEKVLKYTVVTMDGNCFQETDHDRALRFSEDGYYVVLVHEGPVDVLNADGTTSSISTRDEMQEAGNAEE